MWSDQSNQVKKIASFPNLPHNLVPVSKLVEQLQTGRWEDLGTKLKKSCLRPSCPHSKATDSQETLYLFP